VKVIFHYCNGDETNADVVAVAPMIDLAVLKVNVGSPVVALKWGDSRELRVGTLCRLSATHSASACLFQQASSAR
jgi:S1-C subfamily serine protease